MAAVRQLSEEGLRVGVSASPLIPGITDRAGELEAVAEAAHQAGAQWFWSGVLFLTPSSAKQFLPFVREKFPRLTKQYEEWYAKQTYAPEKYRNRIAERVARLKQKYGFDARPLRDTRQTRPCAQMKLSWDAAAVSSEPEGMPSHRAG
jgi:DNA repair photolyase